MRKCESCGKMFQESKDVFCPHCGAIATHKRIDDTHDNMLDSSRWARGDAYRPTDAHRAGDSSDYKPASGNTYTTNTNTTNTNTTNTNTTNTNTYSTQPGSENPYSKPLYAGGYTSANKSPFPGAAKKYAKNTPPPLVKGIGIFITIVVIVNILITVFANVSDDNYSYNNIVDNQEIYENGTVFAHVTDARVMMPNREQPYYGFDLVLGRAYLENSDFSTEYNLSKVVSGINEYNISAKELPYEVLRSTQYYDEVTETSSLYPMVFENGVWVVDGMNTENTVIYIGDISYTDENNVQVIIDLPFDAFSINGEDIVYYKVEDQGKAVFSNCLPYSNDKYNGATEYKFDSIDDVPLNSGETVAASVPDTGSTKETAVVTIPSNDSGKETVPSSTQ